MPCWMSVIKYYHRNTTVHVVFMEAESSGRVRFGDVIKIHGGHEAGSSSEQPVWPVWPWASWRLCTKLIAIRGENGWGMSFPRRGAADLRPETAHCWVFGEPMLYCLDNKRTWGLTRDGRGTPCLWFSACGYVVGLFTRAGTQEGQLAGDTNGQFQTDCGEVG